MARQLDRLRRVVVSDGLSHADDGRSVRRIGLQHLLVRLDRLPLVVLLEEKIAPRGINRRIVGCGGGRIAIHAIGLMESSQGAQRPRGARQVGGVTRAVARRDAFEHGGRVRAAEHLLQQPEHERRFARRRLSNDRPQHGFGLRVPAARDRGARLQRDDVRIARVEFVGELIDLLVPPFEEGASGELQWLGRAA